MVLLYELLMKMCWRMNKYSKNYIIIYTLVKISRIEVHNAGHIVKQETNLFLLYSVPWFSCTQDRQPPPVIVRG